MHYFLPKDAVIESINYFKELQIDTDDNLFLYLLAKHVGVSTTYPVTFLSGNLSDHQKQDYLEAVWMLAGLFDATESGEKKCLIFPNSFKKVAFYQPGTEFPKIIGRIKDTIEKKNLNVPMYDDNDSYLKLKRNYQDIMKEYYLKGNKISFKHLVAWIFRYTQFEFETAPSDKEFTRVLEKAARKFLRVTKRDYLWLFEDDLSYNRIPPSTVGITGEEIRAQFTFDPTKMPEITPLADDAAPLNNRISKELTNQYLALNGDNPTDKEILNTLLDKKQLVLTGVPGVGKSRYTTILMGSDNFTAARTEMVQFHANYSYEDFIGSETLTNVNGATVVTTRPGVFLDFVEKAKNDPDHKYLFIIDELNRGNIAEIFGETILTLDRGYKVRLTKEIKGITSIEIPSNVYIVGTMNTSDRNIAFLDLAIRRRFAFINLLPNYDFLSEKVEMEGIDLGNVLKVINQRILDTLGNPELLLGQSYFIPNDKAMDNKWTIDSFKNQFNFVLLPTLREYSFNNTNVVNTIVGENLSDTIQDLDEFFNAFSAEFSI